MIDIKQEACLTFNFRIAGFIIIAFGVFSLTELLPLLFSGELSEAYASGNIRLTPIILSPILILLGLLILTAHYRLQIDPIKKIYNVYTWLLGFKSGKPTRFNSIEKFYINNVTEQGTFTSRAGLRYNIRDNTYKAFIKLDNGEKLHLDTDHNEDKLKHRIDQYAVALKNVYKPN